MRRPTMNRWNFVEETEESQWAPMDWNNNRQQRRPRRNMTWESRRRRNTSNTWDQVSRPTWNSSQWSSPSWNPRPRRNNSRWFNQTRRNRTDRMGGRTMNRWNFVEETEESQWNSNLNWNIKPKPAIYYPNRNNTWGMPQYDRPIYRPTPQWFNQTWRRPNWNNVRFEEETEESQFSGRGIRRRNETESRDFRGDRPIRDTRIKDNKKPKQNPKGDKKGGLKKGEQKGWWSRFADKFRSNKNRTDEAKPLKPNRPTRPMRPGMRPRPRLNTTLFL